MSEATTSPAPVTVPKPYACLCCDCRTRELQPMPTGNPERCPVCGWVSDFRQERDWQLRGRPNGVSLREARANYRAMGAAQPGLLGVVRRPADGERPLRWGG